MSIELVVLLILLFLILQAFFAGSEIALISCDKIKMRSLADEGSAAAGLVLDAYSKIESFIGTTLIGVNLSLIINTLVLTFYFEETFGSEAVSTRWLYSPRSSSFSARWFPRRSSRASGTP